MRPKHRIDVFTQPPWIKTISCDGKPCGGAAGAGSCSPTVTRDDAGGACHSAACGDSKSCPGQKPYEDLAARYDADLQIADYSSFAAIMSSIDELNRILVAAGESLTVTLDNLDLVFSAANRARQTQVGKTGLDDLEKAGTKVVRSTPEQRAAFAKLVRPTYEKIVGADVAAAFIKASDANR